MKKLILTSIASFALCIAMAQVVTVETEIQGNDTLRTFFVDGGHCDMFTENMTSAHGTPEGANTGTMEWANVDITGVGQNMDIHITDGVMAWQNNDWNYIVFNNPTHKQAQLYADPARRQRMSIEVKKGPNNKVNTAAKEAAMIQFIEAALFN